MPSPPVRFDADHPAGTWSLVWFRRRDRVPQLAKPSGIHHLTAMPIDQTYSRTTTRPRATPSRAPIIDQEGREIRPESLGSGTGGSSFDFRTSSANPFGNLTREQRIARLEALAKLLDVAFILPGTNIRYGIDGIIGLIPVVGDIITTAISLWVVREARALGAPWHITARMLANVALHGAVGAVPAVGDAFDVMFRVNIRNMRMLRRWIDRQR
jgi:hypothetical protein